LFGFIGLLKLNLEQNFGEKWQEQILKRMPSEHVAAFRNVLLLLWSTEG
jgi:hypothetical protein